MFTLLELTRLIDLTEHESVHAPSLPLRRAYRRLHEALDVLHAVALREDCPVGVLQTLHEPDSSEEGEPEDNQPAGPSSEDPTVFKVRSKTAQSGDTE